ARRPDRLRPLRVRLLRPLPAVRVHVRRRIEPQRHEGTKVHCVILSEAKNLVPGRTDSAHPETRSFAFAQDDNGGTRSTMRTQRDRSEQRGVTVMLRIPVDFNTMDWDCDRRVWINTLVDKDLDRALYPGLRVLLADTDLEVEAVVERDHDEGTRRWLARPDWSTQRDIAYR